MKLFLLLLLCLFGCSPTSLDDFRNQGQSVTRSLIQDLRLIQAREDLAKLEPILKKRFEALVFIMIEAREFQINNPEAIFSEPSALDMDLNEELKQELERVWKVEGGREMIERAQREAMLRLDGFEKIKEKQKDLRIK